MTDADFIEADYERLEILLRRDPKLVDLLIHLTGGTPIDQAARRLIERGNEDLAQGESLLSLAAYRADAA